jgi:hypothetical protein
MANPQDMFAAMNAFKKFQGNHPKAVAFFQHEILGGVPEGTVIEFSVTKPGTEKVTSNLKVTQDDIDMFNDIRNMKR